MWLALVKTFFIGQVALEQAAEAVKKQTVTAREKGEHLQENLQHKVEELKSEKLNSQIVLSKFENNFKENVAALRKGFRPFDKACDSLSALLGETAELKETLAQQDITVVEVGA